MANKIRVAAGSAPTVRSSGKWRFPGRLKFPFPLLRSAAAVSFAWVGFGRGLQHNENSGSTVRVNTQLLCNDASVGLRRDHRERSSRQQADVPAVQCKSTAEPCCPKVLNVEQLAAVHYLDVIAGSRGELHFCLEVPSTSHHHPPSPSPSPVCERVSAGTDQVSGGYLR